MKLEIDEIPEEVMDAFLQICTIEKKDPKTVLHSMIVHFTQNYWAEKGYKIVPDEKK